MFHYRTVFAVSFYINNQFKVAYKKLPILLFVTGFAFSVPCNAHAGFIVSSAVLEFTHDSPRHQDVEVISQSDKNDYIVAEVAEILHPGEKNESRHVLEDSTQAALLVSPDRAVLAGRSRKVLRFILLQEPDAQEHIYRVAIKPVIKGTGTSEKLGLKVLIGYEVMVIVRPQAMHPGYTAHRQGKEFIITNTGNTNILFQGGQQCTKPEACEKAPVARVYPGLSKNVILPRDMPVSYSIWDGTDTTEKQF